MAERARSLWRAGCAVLTAGIASTAIGGSAAHANLGTSSAVALRVAPSASASAATVPAATAPAAAAMSGTGDTMSVRVRGGRMTVSPATVTVALVRQRGRMVGDFGPVVVTDARGSLVGWTLTATASTPAGASVRIRPSDIVAVTGNAGEAIMGSPGIGSALLMSAPSEGGGGQFAISGHVEAADPSSVTLTFDIR